MKKSLPEGWAMHAYDDEILWWGGAPVDHDAPVVVTKPHSCPASSSPSSSGTTATSLLPTPSPAHSDHSTLLSQL